MELSCSTETEYCSNFNPLNAELNPICHILVLLGDLTFMVLCIVNIFQYTSNKKQRYTVYLYLETALHVSGGISTHHQEHIQLCLQDLVFVTPLLLSAAIVEELEPVWVCCGWHIFALYVSSDNEIKIFTPHGTILHAHVMPNCMAYCLWSSSIISETTGYHQSHSCTDKPCHRHYFFVT
jgi:hypothetical protein